MKSDPLDPNRRFSLKRFFSNSESHTPAFTKKRKTIISLSKSRSNTCSQSSQQSQQSATDLETLSIKTKDSVCRIGDNENINIKKDIPYTSIAEKQHASKQQGPQTCVNQQDVNLPLVEDELIKEESIKEEIGVFIKKEQMNEELYDMPTIKDMPMKEEVKNEIDGILTEEDVSTKEKLKRDITINNAPTDLHLSKDGTSLSRLQEYTCPICDQDLTHVKSSYMRQNHVESCILNQPISSEEQELEFDSCVFCGKDLSRFKPNQRQYHLNNCLDDAQQIEEAEAAAVAREKEEMFAGQRVPFLSTLDICPVCHEFDPFTGRTLKQKMKHIKQCAKQNRLSLDQLLKKFRWIGWGHVPVAASSSDPLPNDVPIPVNIPDHQLVAYVQDLYDDEDDDGDFTQNIIIHKKRTVQSTTKEDKDDEELQTALALSRSVQQCQVKRKQRLRLSDERDWNAANIWCMEESRLKAVTKLDELLFSGQVQPQTQIEETLLGPSRLHIPSANDQFYWNLTSNKDSNWDNPSTFVSLFIYDLRKE
jgi:transposase-like protein